MRLGSSFDSVVTRAVESQACYRRKLTTTRCICSARYDNDGAFLEISIDGNKLNVVPKVIKAKKQPESAQVRGLVRVAHFSALATHAATGSGGCRATGGGGSFGRRHLCGAAPRSPRRNATADHERSIRGHFGF